MKKQAPPIERPLPFNGDAERALLATGILDNKALPELMEFVKAEDFFLLQHRYLYLAMVSMTAAGKPVEFVTLTDTLQRAGQLEAAGGPAYVASITDGAAKVSNIKHYANIVRETARRRRLIHIFQALQDRAFESEDSFPKLLEDGTQELLSLMSQEGSASMPSPWSEAVVSAMDEIVDSIRNKGAVMQFQFGIPRIDDMTAGWRRQDLNLLVGMTSHGKSLLAMQGAITADNQGYKGLIFSAEMSKEALAKRELAHTARVPLYLLRRPGMIKNTDLVLSDLTKAAGEESKRKLTVVDRDIKPGRVWSLCEFVHRSTGLDFVILDYDQLVIRAGLRMHDDEFRAQAEFMAEALALTKRLNICFIVLCQPRKVDEDVARGRRPPRVEQIFGSSAVANTAHNILWIMRHYFTHGMDITYEKSATSYILKARNDKTGKVDHGFDPDRVLFTDEQEASPEVQKRS
jgi:replicative DNA helicase